MVVALRTRWEKIEDAARWKKIGAMLDGLELELATRYQQIALLRAQIVEDQLKKDYPPSHLTPGFDQQYREHLRPIWWRAWRLGRQTAAEELGFFQYQESPWDPDTTRALEEKIIAQRVKLESAATKQKIRDLVMKGIKEGQTMDELADTIRTEVGWNQARAYRIARTETTSAFNHGRWETFLEAEVEYVKILNVLDFKTCDYCREMHGKVLAMSIAEEGYLPPFHPHCRCTIAPADGEEIPKSGSISHMHVVVDPQYTIPTPPLLQQGYGFVGGSPKTQLEVEESIPALAEERQRLIRYCKFIPHFPERERLAMNLTQHLQAILTQHVSLSRLRLLDKVRGFNMPEVVFRVVSPDEEPRVSQNCAGYYDPITRNVAVMTSVDRFSNPVRSLVVAHETFHCFSETLQALHPTFEEEELAIYREAVAKLRALIGELTEHLPRSRILELYRLGPRELYQNLSKEIIGCLVNEKISEEETEALFARLRGIAPTDYGMTNYREYVAEWAGNLVVGTSYQPDPKVVNYIRRIYARV